MDSEAFVNKSQLIVGDENPSRLCVSSRKPVRKCSKKNKKNKKLNYSVPSRWQVTHGE